MRGGLVNLMVPTSCYTLYNLPKATVLTVKICKGNKYNNTANSQLIWKKSPVAQLQKMATMELQHAALNLVYQPSLFCTES